MTRKTAVIYARVSTARQADDELPIDSQIEQCKKKAEDLGAEVVRTFIDDGISGRLDNRPAFQDAILYCDTFSVDYFITWSSSRFARNKIHAAHYKVSLQKSGVQLVYVCMDVDTSTTGGWLLDGVLELFDDLYSKQISEDTLRSMMKNARAGFWNGGGTPFGFRAVPHEENRKRKRLVADPSESAVLRKIFEMRADGMGARNIALLLNDEGYTNRGKKWNKTVIASLLRNEAVAGRTVFGRKDRSTGRRRPRDQWLVVDSHEPAIPIELWDTVQQMLDGDKSNTESGSPHSTCLFTGILKCGQCGSSMQIESAKGRSRRYWYYNCRAAMHERAHKPRRINARELDSWLVDAIADRVFTRDALIEVIESLHEACSSWAKDRDERRKSLVSRLHGVQQRNENIYELFELHGKDAPNLGDLTARLRKNNAEISALQAELDAVDAEQPPEIAVTEEDAADLSAFLTDTIKTSDNQKRVRAFFSSFINAIWVDADQVRIEYKPELLVQAAPVHSTVVWLPGRDVLGTTTLQLSLPERFSSAA